MKKYFLLFHALLINLVCTAQSPNLNWIHSYGGTVNDYPLASIIDDNENIYWSGYSDSDTLPIGSNVLLGTLYHPNFLLAKHDAAGNIIWAKRNQGPASSVANSIGLDAFGNIYTTGQYGILYMIIGADTLLSANSHYFLAKFDNSGNAIWSRSADTIGRHVGFKVLPDPSGNIYVAGVFYDSIMNIGNFQLNHSQITSQWDADVFLAKYDPLGNVLWVKHFGGNRDVVMQDLCFDHQGMICFSGNFDADTIAVDANVIINSNQNSPNIEAFVGKIDTSGNIIWISSISGNKNDWGNGVESDQYGNVFLSGQFTSDTVHAGTFEIYNPFSAGNEAQFYVVKFSPAGNPLWAKDSGGLGDEVFSDIKTDSSGSTYVAFVTGSDSLEIMSQMIYNTGQSNDYDLILGKIDSAGNYVWVKQIADGSPLAVSLDLANNSQSIYLTGNFWSDHLLCDSILIPNTENSEATCDIFIAKYSFTITEIQKPNQAHAGQLFPNPAEHFISLSGETKPDRVFIITTTGQQTEVPLLENNSIDLSSFSNGFYLLKTQDKTGEKVYRFIKHTLGN